MNFNSQSFTSQINSFSSSMNNQANNFSPLTITTEGNVSPLATSSQSQIWSPFSTPSFSPYNSDINSSFQYSTFYSPNIGLRPISKSINNSQKQSLYRTSAFQNATPFASNFVNQPRHESLKDQPSDSPVQQENIKQSTQSNKRSLPKRSDNIDMTELIRQAAVQRALGGRAKICTFCKTNGESEEIYSSHSLKDSNDKITCPILMRYSCPVCGASGEKTHTKKYCPQLQKKIRFEMLKKMTKNSF